MARSVLLHNAFAITGAGNHIIACTRHDVPRGAISCTVEHGNAMFDVSQGTMLLIILRFVGRISCV